MSFSNSNSPNKRSNHEEILYSAAKEVFDNLKFCLGSDGNSILLEELMQLIEIFKKESNLNEEIVKYIKEFEIVEFIQTNKLPETGYNVKISEKQFCDFITGRQINKILFSLNLNEKRQNLEKIENLYAIMGGELDGLSLDKLNKSFGTFKEMVDRPGNFVQEGAFQKSKNINPEAQDIIDVLSTHSNGKLSIQDFLNIMSVETSNN